MGASCGRGAASRMAPGPIDPVGPMRALILALACLVGSAASAELPIVRHGPPPAWVERLPIPDDGDTPTTGLRGGIRSLLFERQTRLGDAEVEHYEREVRRVASQPGTDAASQITIEFDPVYEELEIHAVRIIRDGSAVDAFRPADLRLLQRETDLENGIHDGTFTATLILEDVRVGDIVDLSFTLRGQNPVFDGHFMDVVWSEGRDPYRRLRHRLLWPKGRRLETRPHGDVPGPTLRPLGDHIEYVWDHTDTRPIYPDSDLPDWYTWYGWTQLSDFADWAEVAAWGERVFRGEDVDSESTRALAARIGERHEQPRARLLAALRFVQDEIRYLGLEIGPHSHRPHDPDTVLRRRFGDCKDKSLLLVSILGELGIEAHPALVNTELGPHVEAWHPSPYAFDHAIVRAEIDGEVVWMDPTRSYQGGGLTGLGHETSALTLQTGVTELERIPGPVDTGPLTRVHYAFDSPDLESPTSLVIRTTAVSDAANWLRARFLGTSRDEIRTEYLEYYAGRYDGIESVAPIEFEDDREANVVRLTEHYAIREFWQPMDDGRFKATFHPMEIRSRIWVPDTVDRSMPIGRDHPDHVSVAIDAKLPMTFEFKDSKQAIDDPAFRFRYEKSVHGRDLSLRYEYESLADSVAPENVKTYLERVDEAHDLLSYSLWKQPGGSSSDTGRRAVAPGLVALVLALLLASPFLQFAAGRAQAQGRSDRAIRLMQWSRRVAPIHFRPRLNRARLSVALGMSLAHDGRYTEATTLITEALRHTARSGALANQIHHDALLAFCLVHLRQRQFERAGEYLDRAEQTATSIRSGKGLPVVYRKLLRVSIDAGLGRTANLHEAISEAESDAAGDRTIAIMAEGIRAEVFEAEGRTDRARDAFERHLRIATEIFGPDHLYVREARRDLADFERRSADAPPTAAPGSGS